MASDASTVFFSYSRGDLDFALRLAKDLKQAGAKVWMDKLELRPGQLWEPLVEEALSACQRMLVILSPDSVKSANVRAEFSFALEEQKEVIPVLYRDCRVPFRLRPFQSADFRSDYSRGFEELLSTVGIQQQLERTPTASSPSTHQSVLTMEALDTADSEPALSLAFPSNPGVALLFKARDQVIHYLGWLTNDEALANVPPERTAREIQRAAARLNEIATLIPAAVNADLEASRAIAAKFRTTQGEKSLRGFHKSNYTFEYKDF